MAAYKSRKLNDQLCLWRCLAYHNQRCKDVENLPINTRRRLQWWRQKQKIDFGGIKLVELGLVEETFMLSICVHEFKPARFNNNFSLTVRKRSGKNLAKIVHLHLYNNRFSYITDIKRVFARSSKGINVKSFGKLQVLCRGTWRGAQPKQKWFTHPNCSIHLRVIFEKLEENELCVKENILSFSAGTFCLINMRCHQKLKSWSMWLHTN